MDQKEPPPPATGHKASTPPAAAPSALARAKAAYDKLFPPESPQRKAGPWVLIAVVLIVLLVAKCAVSSAGEKISAVTQARAEEKRVRTTGVLLVKSNRPEATVEAVRLASADDPSTDRVNGALGQALPNLTPGKYAVKLRAEGWPDASGEVDVPPGQQTETTINFKGGSLRVDSVPAGKAVLGKTPVLIPQLPPGEISLSLEYQSWPAVPHKVTITENQESAATVRLPHGRLVVNSIPAGATVVLQGKAYNKTPLFFDPIAAGSHKLTLQAKDFPPLEVTATVEDRGETTIGPELGTAFPLLDPEELLRAVWVPDNPDKIVDHDGITGPEAPQNGVVKNLNRKFLYKGWLDRRYRFSAVVKSYDAATGKVEFAEQAGSLSRYRVVATLTPNARNDRLLATPPAKGTTFTLSLYGQLTAVEEPRWPAKVIRLDISSAEVLH
jgi:hypothetical protein